MNDFRMFFKLLLQESRVHNHRSLHDRLSFFILWRLMKPELEYCIIIVH